MRKVALDHSEIINGQFEPKALNLLFVFQVNCPGCFVHGIPIVNQLVDTFRDRLPILGLSTAFEDFELNTLENTKAFVQRKKVVGETARYFGRYPEANVPEVHFPVAFDTLVSGSAFVTEENLKRLIDQNPYVHALSPRQSVESRQSIKAHYQEQAIVPKSFTLNQLRGTPSFVFFNAQFELVLEHFGGLELSKLLEWLTPRLT